MVSDMLQPITHWGYFKLIDSSEKGCTFRITAPRDTPDGIGSALAWIDLREDTLYYAKWWTLKKWHDESVQGLWIMLMPLQATWPIAYWRFYPEKNRAEHGFVEGPDPEHQRIISTRDWLTDSCELFFRLDKTMIHFSQENIHWSQARGMWVVGGMPDADIVPGFYCEASSLLVTINEVE